MRNIILKSSLFLSLFAFAACGKDEPTQQNDTYSTGVFVVNEGVWGMTSGAVSLYNPLTKTVVSQDLFQLVNSRELGNVVQSISFDDDNAYIVVNAANKIEIVDKNSWAEKSQITDVENPRYAQVLGNYLYVTQWGSDGITGSVRVYNKADFSLHTTITTYSGANKMLLVNGKLWVTHIGGYVTDNRIAVINLSNNTIESTITLSYDNLSAIMQDQSNNIWVSCAGQTNYLTYPDIDSTTSTPAALIQLSASGTVLKTVPLEIGGYASTMSVDKENNIIYFLYKEGIYQYNISTETTSLYKSGSFYGLDFDNQKHELYISRSNGVNPSTVIRLTDTGTAVDSFSTGAAYANGFNFKN